MTVKARARRRLDGRRAAIGLAACVALGASHASAHPEFSALGTNRYVTAAIFDGRVDVTDALLEGTLASGEERRRLDTDGDGRISDAELRAGEERLRAEGPAVTAEVDGRPLVAPLVVAIDVGEEQRTTAAPVVVERRASFPGAWPAGAHRLRVAITRDPPRVLDTEIGVVLGPGLALAGGADSVTFRGPRASSLEERAATFDVTAPPPVVKGKPRVALVSLGLLLVVVAGAVAALRRARSSARP